MRGKNLINTYRVLETRSKMIKWRSKSSKKKRIIVEKTRCREDKPSPQ